MTKTKLRVTINCLVEAEDPNVVEGFAVLLENVSPDVSVSEVEITSYEDEPFDDDLLPDDVVKALEENIDQSMPVRYPTFNLVRRIATTYARLQRLKELDAPELVIKNTRAGLLKSVAQLAQALPYDVENRLYDPQRVLDHFVGELQESHGSDRKDS